MINKGFYRLVLASSIAFINALGIKCIVEGVENLEMENLLKELECDFFQGYYYSKPIDENSTIKFLHEHLGDNLDGKIGNSGKN